MAQISSVWSQPTSATKKVVPFTGTEKAKFLAYDGAKDDYYGFAVSVSYAGETIAIGAYLDDDVKAGSGSVYVYRKNGTTWSFHQKIVASDALGNDYSGECVAVSGDGNRILISASNDDDNGLNSGTGRVYVLQNNVWVLEAKLLGTTTTSSDYFSRGLDINHLGNRAVLSAYADDIKATDGGSITIFKRVNSAWTEEITISGSTTASTDYFGRAVAISGDGLTVVSGAYQDDDEGTNSGCAFVFRYIDNSWSQIAKLIHTDVASGDYFGFSVDISYNGKTVAIGAYCDDDKGSNSGSVHIFTEINGVWAREAKLIASDGAATDYYGYSVCLSNNGKSLVISSHLDDDKGSGSGSAYFYNKVNGVWTFFKKMVPSDGAASDNFSQCVRLSGNGKIVLVGSHLDDDKGSASGSAYLFS